MGAASTQVGRSSLGVRLGARSYQVRLATDFGGLAPALRRLSLGHRALLVTDRVVGPLYGAAARRAAERAGLEVAVAAIRAGESQKSLARAAELYERALDHRLERGDLIIALGGGVVGDLAGFVASTYLRGIDVVQLPTTLLAMVDASIGGKTGVNLRRGKNLVGAFHQPRLVYANLAALRSLPPRQVRAGLAEVIKCAMIRDAGLCRHLENHLPAILDLEPDAIGQAVRRAAGVKARIVAADEREGGVRALLNYGHTVGHAVETVTRYRRFLHGEAVALGMVAAGAIGLALGVSGAVTIERQNRLIAASGLPVTASGLDRRAVFAALRHDKKAKAGKLRFVLTSRVGSARLHPQPSVHCIRSAIASITNHQSPASNRIQRAAL